MNKTSYSVIASIVFIAIVSVSYYLLKSSSNNERCEIKIAAVPAAFYLPLFVAHDQGMLSVDDCTSEVIIFNSVNDQMTALLNSDAHVSAIGSGGLFSLEAASPGRIELIYGQQNQSYSLLVSTDSEIDTLEQLEGKRIGTWPSPTPRVFLHLILDSIIGKDNFEIVPIEFRFLTQALSSGEVDVLFNTDVFTQQAIEYERAKYLSERPLEEYIMEPFFNGGGLVLADLKTKNPKLYEVIISGVGNAINFIHENPQAARQSLVTHIGINDSIAQAAPIDFFVTLDELDSAKVQDVADILYESGVVSERISIFDMQTSTTIK